jgi:predicted nucleic acid-binding protein
VDIAPKAPYTCKDADDQKFIDLAAAHRAVLLSKDKAVLRMAKRLATLGVSVGRQWAPAATQTPQTIS